MPQPLVSVIMPCRDGGRMLYPAIESIVAQSYTAIEIIFVDNGSSDDSLAVARGWAAKGKRPFQILDMPEPGVNLTRNFGYRFAQGDYIQWMDADDHMHPEKIALQVAAMERDREIDIAYGDWIMRRFISGGPPYIRRSPPRYIDDQITRTLAQVWFPPLAYLFRRAPADRLQAEQAWWPNRPVATDIEYMALAALLGLRFRYTPRAAVVYNVWSPSQMGGRIDMTARIPVLRAIYARLGEIAARPDVKPRITAGHRSLLNQPWDLSRMTNETVAVAKLPGRQVRLNHVTSGHSLDVRPRDATIAQAMMEMGNEYRTLCHHALGIADKISGLAEGHVAIVRALETFSAAGLLDRAPV